MINIELLNQIILGNTILNYIYFIAILISGIFIMTILKKIVRMKIIKLNKAKHTEAANFLTEMINKNLYPFLYLVLFYFTINTLVIPETLNRLIKGLNLVAGTILFINATIAFIRIYVIHKLHNIKKDSTKIKIAENILSIVKVFLWIFGTIFILDNFGYKISTLIAGLGFGGIAVALAAQALLRDMFSYFSIFLDKPFEHGDFIVVDSFSGTIEHVGLKTTRLRSTSGEELIFSNNDLTGSRIRNFKKMEKRRVLFNLSVVPSTKQETLELIPGLIKEQIAQTKKTVLDRVHFTKFNNIGYEFEVVYFVLSKDYNIYMDIQQNINIAITKIFAEKNIKLAFPTSGAISSNLL